MRVLIDTNVFIYREDDHIVPQELSELFRILGKIKAEVLVHPDSIKEIERDNDETRKMNTLSKIRAYNLLNSPPYPKEDVGYLGRLPSSAKLNDRMDTNILYSVYKNAVDFLITEDRGIHKKASRVGIDERVFLIDEAINFFKNYLPEVGVTSPPAITEANVYDLDIDDPIFDTLKGEYGSESFKSWFEKVSREGRKCWVHYRRDESIGALLIYKLEDEPLPTTPPFPKKLRLKIATMKVTYVGHKIGELFIKLSVDIALQNGVDEIYLTHFTKREDHLVDLISQYGFEKVAVKDNGEDVYLKKLRVEESANIGTIEPIEISRKYYPSLYDGLLVKKFIVPIKPQYHQRLFIDYPRRQTLLNEYDGEFIEEGNTIKKAYLSHSRITKIKEGDLVLFYRSVDLMSITSIGVVENIYTSLENVEQIVNSVGKRTVYTWKEIEDMVAEAPIMVLLFRHHFHLKSPVGLELLQELNILQRAPQSISELPHISYLEIKKRGGINESFTVH